MEFFFIIALSVVVFILRLFKNGIQPPRTKAPTRPSQAPKDRRGNRAERIPPKAKKTIEHAPPPPLPVSKRLIGKAWVIDGDTIVIDKIKVRLAGVDAPELDQPWGKKSKWEMVRICKGQTIRAELTGETSYDRLVGTCYLPDGRDIGAEIVKAGLALDGSYFSKGKYKDLEDPEMRRNFNATVIGERNNPRLFPSGGFLFRRCGFP